MKKINILVLSALTITVIAIGGKNESGHVIHASQSDWSAVGATLNDVSYGVEMSSLSWGARAHTTNLITLDGFEFDFEFTNIVSGSVAGFYFGLTHYYYAPQTGSDDNAITFSLNSSATYFNINQNRFGTFNTHDIQDKNGAQTYTDTSLSKPDGFGYSDGTCVMNKHDSQKIHFAFEKCDSTWYKMSMTDLLGSTFWTIENQKPVNNTLTVYFKASQIQLDEYGRTYLFGFGFNGDGNESPVIRFTNYQGDTSAPVININKTEFKTFAGLLPDESFTAIDNKDGYVPITYEYPLGALDENGKLIVGDWNVVLKAKDKAKNETTVTLTYHVEAAQTREVAHRVVLNATGCDVSIDKQTFFEQDKVWFTICDEADLANTTIDIKDQDGNKIEYKGTNPFYFVMPNKEVTLNVTSNCAYVLKNNVNAHEVEYINYLGRHYAKNGGIYFANSNAGFGLDIKATEATNRIVIKIDAEATFVSETTQYAQVFVDGNRYGDRIVINNNDKEVIIAENLALGEHIIEFKKCNEAQYSNLILKEISFTNTKIKKYAESRPIIEFYGDSISCGYGNLGSGSGFSLSTEDATQAYTNLTADALGYRSSSIAYSGIGLYRSWTHSEITAMTLYKQIDGHEYNMRKDDVKISVINLGTNDNVEYNSLSEGDKPKFVNGMKKNIKAMMNAILDNHPDSSIIICYEMMTAMSNDIIQCYKEAIAETKAMWGVDKIFIKQFDRNELGVDGHPNLDGHKNAASLLVNFIKENNLN